MEIPQDLHFTKEHEWIRIDGQTGTIGITDFAQSSLGDVTFLDLPKEGNEIKKGKTFGVVESVKAVSDLYAPVSGRVLAVNQSLIENPDRLNHAPYTDAWMIKIAITGDSSERSELMTAEQYQLFLKEI